MVDTFISRKDRPEHWGQLAAAASRARGGGALDAAMAYIDATFDGVYGGRSAINELKLAVERAIRRGADHIDTYGNYRKLVYFLHETISLESAIVEIERNYLFTKLDNKRRSSDAFFAATANPMRELRLAEVRLFLRWYRRFADRRAYPLSDIIASITGTRDLVAHEAAE